MNWYENKGSQWKEIIETVASEEHRQATMIEKDMIQSFILFHLSQSTLPFVFKGGTSLSKAYGLIDRFSEDIDLSMSRRLTEAERRTACKTVCGVADKLGLRLSNPDEIKSRNNYNKYVFEYDSFFSDIPLELIVETNFFQRAYPLELHKVSSFVGLFCAQRGIELPIPFAAAEINMQVQSLVRTFIDKVFAVCDYRLQNMQDRDSRHLYDIAKILPEIQITPELDALIDDVRDERLKSKNNPSAQLKYDIPEILKEIIDSRFYESDYNNITKKLLYEELNYEEAVSQGIAPVADMDIFKYRK